MPAKDLKDKKKKSKKEIILDGKNISKMTQEKLVRHAILELKLLLEAKKQRSRQVQECDMLFRKLEIVRNEVIKQEASLITHARDMEKSQYMQHAELKVGRQRTKHLRYELDQELEKARIDCETFTQEMRRGHLELMTEAAHVRDELETTNMEERQAYEQDTKEIMAQAEQKYGTACDNYKNALVDRTEDLHLEKEQLDEDFQLDIRNNICLFDQKRLEQIDTQQQNFEKNYHEIKRYFQELTYHNLTLINALANQSRRLKRHLIDLYARCRCIQKQTEANREPARKQTIRLATLRHELNCFDKEKLSFARLRKTYAGMNEERGRLQAEITERDDKYFCIKKEYAFLKENFVPAVSEAKGIIGCEASVIRGKAANLKTQIDHVYALLREAVLNNPDARMEQCLHQLELTERQCLNNLAMKKDMQTTLQKMSKLYNDTLITMRCIVGEYGLPADELDLHDKSFIPGMACKPAEIGRVSATLAVLRPYYT